MTSLAVLSPGPARDGRTSEHLSQTAIRKRPCDRRRYHAFAFDDGDAQAVRGELQAMLVDLSTSR
jgi:hypothetical protein